MFQYSCLPFLAPVQPGGCLDYKVFYISFGPSFSASFAGALASLTDAAAIFSVRYFVIHPGPENIDLEPSGDRFDCLRFAAEVLGQVAEHCRQVGIGCAIENKLPHLLFASIRDLLWILASMGQVPIGVCLDTGHGQLAGDLRSIIQKLTGYLLMVHAHDNHGRGDDHQPPGTGSGFQFGSRPTRIRSARGVYRLLVITQNRLND